MTQAKDKSSLRQQLRQRLAALAPLDRHRRSVATTDLLLSTPEFHDARVIMIYLAMPHEIDTAPIALRAWQEGKQVVVPRIYWSDRTLLPVEIQSLATPMDTDHRGMRQPETGQPMPVDLIDLVVVPGLGFGLAGQRIGRGHGFYDRFLVQEAFHGISCGLGFDSQIVSELPMLPHDIPLNMLVTESGIHRFSHAASRHQQTQR